MRSAEDQRTHSPQRCAPHHFALVSCQREHLGRQLLADLVQSTLHVAGEGVGDVAGGDGDAVVWVGERGADYRENFGDIGGSGITGVLDHLIQYLQ
jgi:hypothetical protein